MKAPTLRTIFFSVLLLAALLLAARLFLPYLLPLSLAATFAVIVQPLHRSILRSVKGRASIAAAITVLLTGFLILLPIAFVVSQVAREAAALYQQIASGQSTLPGDVIAFVEGHVRNYFPSFSLNLTPYVGQAFGFIAGNLQSLLSGTFGGLFHLFLGIIAFYYFLKDGSFFIRALVSLSPLGDREDWHILGRLERAINSIIRGSFIIATLQGIVTGIGLAIFGVPNPVLWGSIAAIGALIPNVGTPIVLIPAILYLFVTANLVRTLGLLVWGVLAVGLIDNLLHPFLVGRGTHIHPLFILFAVIGGLAAFGIAGFILGPVILSLLTVLLEMYRERFLGKDQV